MGRSYLFECSKCGYRATVSGGADRGLQFRVQTMLCRDCGALFDAVVRLKVTGSAAGGLPMKLGKGFGRIARSSPTKIPETPPPFASVLNRLPVRGQFTWVQFKPRCPVSPVHKVRAWNAPDRCPKCGTCMERGALPFRIWE